MDKYTIIYNTRLVDANTDTNGTLIIKNNVIHKIVPHKAENLYLSQQQDRVLLRKNKVYYASFKNIEDARRVRDWFITHGWNKLNIDKACKACGVERCGK